MFQFLSAVFLLLVLLNQNLAIPIAVNPDVDNMMPKVTKMVAKTGIPPPMVKITKMIPIIGKPQITAVDTKEMAKNSEPQEKTSESQEKISEPDAKPENIQTEPTEEKARNPESDENKEMAKNSEPQEKTSDSKVKFSESQAKISESDAKTENPQTEPAEEKTRENTESDENQESEEKVDFSEVYNNAKVTTVTFLKRNPGIYNFMKNNWYRGETYAQNFMDLASMFMGEVLEEEMEEESE